MTDKSASANFDEFLAHFGKTLSRINLYSLNHPLVQESVKASFESLDAFLKDEPEVVLATSEGKLLLNGTILNGIASIQQMLVQFFEKNHLYSLTFKRGLAVSEISSFYKLFTGKKEDMKNPEEFSKFLTDEKVTNISINAAFFSKVSEKGDPVEGGDGGPARTAESNREKTSSIMQKMENMSLDNMLREIISQAIPDPEDQKKIYEIIFRQIQGELNQQVEKATHAIKEEKQKVTNEQERTESVVQNVAEGVMVVDLEGKIVMMNPVAEKIYGKSFNEVKGRKVDELAGDEIMITFAKEFGTPSDRSISREVLIQSNLATQRLIKQSTAMIENPDGRVVGIMSILTDIAKQREMQRMQDQFLANVTHELRSPLTAIKASLGTLATDDEIKFSDSQKNMLNIANRNIDRLARLINDILDFAKIAEGRITINTKPLDTKALLNDIVTSLLPWAQNKQISLSYAPEGPVPRVMADADRIIQVLVNLLSNAIKFTPKEGKITLTTKSSPLAVRISVTDTGPGIPKADQEKIFQKFFQLKQTQKMDTPGTGLGLYITKKIIELHQGEIGFESEEGKGTTFWFTLPLVPESAVKETQKTQAQKAAEQKKSWLSRFFGR